MASGIIEVNKEENLIITEVNPKIYNLDVIYSAAYVFLDKAYIRIDGDVNEKIIVELRPKEEYDLEKLAMEFNNELLNYAFYKKQSEKTQEIKKIMLQRALLTIGRESKPAEPENNKEQDKEFLDENMNMDNFSGNPEEVMPWEDNENE